MTDYPMTPPDRSLRRLIELWRRSAKEAWTSTDPLPGCSTVWEDCADELETELEIIVRSGGGGARADALIDRHGHERTCQALQFSEKLEPIIVPRACNCSRAARAEELCENDSAATVSSAASHKDTTTTTEQSTVSTRTSSSVSGNLSSLAALGGGADRPAKEDPVCEHGTALDVHCCNCHSGFLFSGDSCVCEFDAPKAAVPPVVPPPPDANWRELVNVLVSETRDGSDDTYYLIPKEIVDPIEDLLDHESRSPDGDGQSLNTYADPNRAENLSSLRERVSRDSLRSEAGTSFDVQSEVRERSEETDSGGLEGAAGGKEANYLSGTRPSEGSSRARDQARGTSAATVRNVRSESAGPPRGLREAAGGSLVLPNTSQGEGQRTWADGELISEPADSHQLGSKVSAEYPNQAAREAFELLAKDAPSTQLSPVRPSLAGLIALVAKVRTALAAADAVVSPSVRSRCIAEGDAACSELLALLRVGAPTPPVAPNQELADRGSARRPEQP